jgi:hypothetical protein
MMPTLKGGAMRRPRTEIQARGENVNRGFTQSEAQGLIGRSFEASVPFSGVRQGSRGLVTEALDADDHWNVLIEWNLPGRPSQGWFTKFELQHYMREVHAPKSE